MWTVMFKALAANPVLAPWASGLQAFWPLLWRLALLLLLFAGGWHYGARAGRNEVAEQRARLLEAHVAAVDALRAEERALAEKSHEVETNYERARVELASVRARVPDRSVRLCREAGGGDVPVPRGTPGVAGPGPGADVPRTVSDDIGRSLFALADQCDEIALRLNALQEWTRAMASAAPTP